MYFQLRQEKVELEQTLEQEQECLVNKLMRKIEKLETETAAKQNDLETLRREKVCLFYFCSLSNYSLAWFSVCVSPDNDNWAIEILTMQVIWAFPLLLGEGMELKATKGVKKKDKNYKETYMLDKYQIWML